MRQQDHSGLLGEMRSRKVADVLRQLTDCNASKIAVSSTTPPREKLSTTAPGLSCAMPPASIMPRVDERYVQREEVAA